MSRETKTKMSDAMDEETSSSSSSSLPSEGYHHEVDLDAIYIPPQALEKLRWGPYTGIGTGRIQKMKDFASRAMNHDELKPLAKILLAMLDEVWKERFMRKVLSIGNLRSDDESLSLLAELIRNQIKQDADELYGAMHHLANNGYALETVSRIASYLPAGRLPPTPRHFPFKCDTEGRTIKPTITEEYQDLLFKASDAQQSINKQNAEIRSIFKAFRKKKLIWTIKAHYGLSNAFTNEEIKANIYLRQLFQLMESLSQSRLNVDSIHTSYPSVMIDTANSLIAYFNNANLSHQSLTDLYQDTDTAMLQNEYLTREEHEAVVKTGSDPIRKMQLF